MLGRPCTQPCVFYPVLASGHGRSTKVPNAAPGSLSAEHALRISGACGAFAPPSTIHGEPGESAPRHATATRNQPRQRGPAAAGTTCRGAHAFAGGEKAGNRRYSTANHDHHGSEFRRGPGKVSFPLPRRRTVFSPGMIQSPCPLLHVAVLRATHVI